ncbi:MAG: 5'-deoxynucleotidase [Eubacteriales bacterium]|nr:5'-deoxynucleotidase [Eubacteriales bacterium]
MIPFYAVVRRLKHIERWQLMRKNFSENVAEHSLEVAILAHALCLIRRELLKLPSPEPELVMQAAIFHDVSECLTGDLPTPVKYHNPDLQKAYKELEKQAEERLLGLLPNSLRSFYEPLFKNVDPEIHRIIKLADNLSAYLKAHEEVLAGNGEFTQAEKKLHEKLQERTCPELEYFMEHCLEAYDMTLDELNSESEINF